MMKSLFAACAVSAVLLAVPATAQKKGDVAKGKEVYEQCGVCHSPDTDEKKMGPSLKGLYKKAKMHNGKKPTDVTVMEVVNKGGNGMPGFDEILNADEKTNLLAYLKTL